MKKYILQSQIKSAGTAYRLWFVFGSHYAYLNKWRLQLLFWFTFGGFFIWAIIDLFTLSGKVAKHNACILQQIDEIEKKDTTLSWRRIRNSNEMAEGAHNLVKREKNSAKKAHGILNAS